MPLASLESMPKPDELQVLILLSLIPTMIAAMYSLTQVSEHLRDRYKARKKAAGSARRAVVGQARAAKPEINSPA